MDVRAADWPPGALAAAAHFHQALLPEIIRAAANSAANSPAITIIFPPADDTYCAWRLAAIQSLARENAPRRVNGLVGSDDRALDQALAYLAAAPGVTGQLLEVDGIPPPMA